MSAASQPIVPGVIVLLAFFAPPGIAHADSEARAVKRIAVAAFDASDAPRARAAVLATLSEHDDVELVSLEDIAVAGRRLQVDPKDVAGRGRLSRELGIDAWLDGSIEDGLARFALHAPDGRVIASTSLQGHKATVAEGLAGPKIWSAMGSWLSARERGKRALEAQEELARKKVRAREQELVRQRQLAGARALQRVAQLQVAQTVARDKRAAFMAELERQRTIVDERRATAEREREQVERKAAAAEDAEFRASLQEGGGPPALAPTAAWSVDASAPSPIAAPVGSNVWLASPFAANGAPMAPPSATQEPVGVSASGPPSTSSLSPATQRWLVSQGGPAPGPTQPSYVQAPPRSAPALSAEDTAGLSPATRRWLEQQNMR